MEPWWVSDRAMSLPLVAPLPYGACYDQQFLHTGRCASISRHGSCCSRRRGISLNPSPLPVPTPVVHTVLHSPQHFIEWPFPLPSFLRGSALVQCNTMFSHKCFTVSLSPTSFAIYSVLLWLACKGGPQSPPANYCEPHPVSCSHSMVVPFHGFRCLFG
jgi:hypothetical protein